MKIKQSLENIYISPLELCNLNCRLCYTHKTRSILSNKQILSFVRRYKKALNNPKSLFFNALSLDSDSEGEKKCDQNLLSLKSILFCGGEVFTLKNFPRLINNLIKRGIFITIITNGTIDRLDKIKDPSNCQLLVSFDGPKAIHDNNRGLGSFEKSEKFVNHALKLGFPVEIMYLVSPESYPFIDSFNISNLPNNYITVKTKYFCQYGQSKSLSLKPEQIINIKKNYRTIPPKNFGCFQYSLQSNGRIYGCCESSKVLGTINDPIKKTIGSFLNSLTTCSNCPISKINIGYGKRCAKYRPMVTKTVKNYLPKQQICNGCCDPDFLCGYKKELQVLSCQDVAKRYS